MKCQRQILHFNEMNLSHQATGFTGRTDIADFHTFTLEETYPSTRTAMPPYTLRFYCIMLLEAKKLLLYTDLPIAEIADYLGFKEPTHFGRFFKRKLALTPLEYRRRLAGEV